MRNLRRPAASLRVLARQKALRLPEGRLPFGQQEADERERATDPARAGRGKVLLWAAVREAGERGRLPCRKAAVLLLGGM